MSSRTESLEGDLRALGSGILTVILTIAAHGLAGGGLVSSGSLAALTIIGAGVGLLARDAGTRRSALTAILAVGQLAGHFTLHLGCDSGSDGESAVSMIAAHLAATTAVALILAAAARWSDPIISTLTRWCMPLTTPLVVDAQAMVVAVSWESDRGSGWYVDCGPSWRGPPLHAV